MAKESTAKAPSKPVLVVREGLRKFSGDVIGFHDFETQGHLYGIPRAAKLSDDNLNSTKPSCFVIFELLEPTKVTDGTAEDSEEITAAKGDMVGVWLKGGMRAIKNLCGLPVLMQHTGEKKLKGKPAAFNPMKTYQFDVGQGKGTLIPIIEDNRKESRNVPMFLEAPRPGQAKREPGADEDEDEDNINF